MTDQPTPRTEATAIEAHNYLLMHEDGTWCAVCMARGAAQAHTEALDVDALAANIQTAIDEALDAAAERVRALITKTDDPYCCVPRTEDAIAAILAAKADR